MISLHRNIIQLSFLLLPCIAVAQQDSTCQPYTESFQLQYHRYANEAITQPLLKWRNYNSVQLNYRSEQGKYMQAQAPQKENEISFYTEGSRQLKKVLVTGSFGWYSNKTDSQAFTLRQNYKDPNPWFFYAAQPGNWQTVRYDLKGMASVPLLQDKLTLGAKATYNSFNAWRSNDPRPEEFLNELRGTAIVHYKITPKHTIGIGGGFINNAYDNNWEYGNDNNKNVPLMAVFIQNGYGNVTTEFTQAVAGYISTKTTGYTTEGLYEGEFPFGTFTLTGKYEYTTAEIFQKNSGQDERKDVYGDFNEDIYTINLNWNKTNKRSIANISFNYRDELGKDYNFELAGNNYLYTLQTAKLEGLWSRLKSNGTMKYEIGASVLLEDRMKKDGSVKQNANFQSLEAAVNGAWYFHIPSNKSTLKTALRAAYRNPYQATTLPVTQTFLFTEGVPYRDYYYFSANTVSIGGQLSYQFPVKQFNPFIALSGNYITASIPAVEPGLVPYSMPGNNRLQWQLSIGVNL